ncbi:tryptophan synthase subunit alpha [Paenalkalicoccus suaedae]|uniref:Tryptophan synthase alpha chain n=1 Tax=Paenalkalicoccus suaedae TaxID=2592382 RepID=A0A859FDZ5_9BACI|nr:tryptophan synthase subunit alpha [Paenalkalicoccus suaedae]QKS71100.1 tryptophan synthase subunit alpha [Paenalkalicoccus suaedae]
MNRLKQDAFQSKKERFVPYIMSSDPSYEASIDIALTLEEAGVDAIEWGVPFSDPLADGPVIQEAGDRARKAGGGLRRAVEGAKEARAKGLTVPLVLFTYINPVLSVGFKEVIELMEDADMDGILIPDLPFEESEELRALCNEKGISLISLVAPSSKNRMEKISRLGDGFIYYVTSLGVTGTRESFAEELSESIQKLRDVASVPVLAGFGISTREHVQHFQSIADGVIVGSALVRFISEREDTLLQANREKPLQEIKSFIEELCS